MLSAVLSFLLPGVGQIYCGQDNKGVFLIGFSLLGLWSTNGMTCLFLCPLLAWDAFLIATKINRGLAAQRWEFFPGIKPLNSIPPRVVRVAIVALIAAVIVLHIVHYASTYHPTG
jgi:TM2 domain-containing membrane protein YozV